MTKREMITFSAGAILSCIMMLFTTSVLELSPLKAATSIIVWTVVYFAFLAVPKEDSPDI